MMPGRAYVPREPGEAIWPMVPAGVEGERSVGAGARVTGRGGAEPSEAGGGATGFGNPGGDGSQGVRGVAAPLRGG